MSRILTEEQQHWCDVIGEFAKKEIEPIMLDWDKVTDPSKAIPFDAYAKANGSTSDCKPFRSVRN